MMSCLAASLVYIITLTGFVHSGEEYLMTFANKTGASLMVAAGPEEGTFHVKYPFQQQRKVIVAANSLFNYKAGHNTSSKHTTIVIDVDIVSTFSVYGRQNEARFIPLSVTELGCEYIVSSCNENGTGTSLLMVTAYNQTTSLNFMYEHAQTFTTNGRVYINVTTFSQKIGAFQSVVLLSENSFSRSRIVSDHVTAVYSGAMEQDVVTMYAQLLPVSHLGKTFHAYFDQTIMPYAAQIMSVHNNTDFKISPFAFYSFSETISFSLTNGYSELKFSKPTSLMLCGKNGMKGMAVLPPQALYQTQVHLPLIGDTLIIIHPHKNRSVTVSDSSIQDDISWSFTDKVHVGVVRTPSIPGESVTIKAGESFYVIATSENHIHTAGYSHVPKCIDQGDNTKTGILLKSGTGASVVILICAGYIRHRRQQQNRPRGNPPEGQGDDTPPPPPSPPPAPV